MENINQLFGQAHDFMTGGQLDAASEIFMRLQNHREISTVCRYHLGTVANMKGDPETAYYLYYSAFKDKPDLAAQLFSNQHSSRAYVFRGKKDEKEQTVCPLCGGPEIRARWCYPLVEAAGYNEFFNPVRMWMYCEPCHHMFARHFPENLFLHNNAPRAANPSFFSYYSQILGNIRRFTPGMTLFEIGIGASECLLAAREIGYEAYGIDVIGRHVSDAKTLYGLDAETADFNAFETDKLWDVIIMGDVLEHVNDPVKAVEKVATLLKPGGCVWISTPSFESAFSMLAGHNDVMRRQQYHLNYFSRESLYNLLDKFGLMPVDYHISGHYNGSMEVVAAKNP